MSKTWYPVIKYENCVKCGACSNLCPNGVFESKELRPSVANPEGCFEGCHGCGDLCRAGAIEYEGDDTGWVPPQKKGKGSCGSISCGF